MDDLIRGLKAGDSRAFERLIREQGDAVFRFVTRLAGRREAEDITQEVFVRVFKSIGAFDPTGSFRGWMFQIANNLCIDHLRTRKTVQAATETLPDVRGGAPSAWMENREIVEALQLAVANLPPDQKQVFLLREEGGLSFKEIAAALHCPLNTALGRMHYAMEHLRKSLRAYRE